MTSTAMSSPVSPPWKAKAAVSMAAAMSVADHPTV